MTPRTVESLVSEGALRDRELAPDFVAVLQRLEARLAEIRELLLSQKTVKDWYSTAELAAVLGKAEFTVREWCRLGRINALKRRSGRGRYLEWVVAAAEVDRLQREGLLPTKHAAIRR